MSFATIISGLTLRGAARVHVLVEGFAPDAVALAHLLRRQGHEVVLAGPGEAPASARELVPEGVSVVPHADLDAHPGTPEVVYVDVWTPEIAPRIAAWRGSGARLTCLSDLLLERYGGITIGVTGTAGKSTTSSFLVQLLRGAGVDVDASSGSRSGNRWATEELVPLLAGQPHAGVLVLELTSSHLAFCAHSPHVAVVTNFWPDHLELHGSLAAYRRAKEAIVRGQRPGDRIVVPADDPGTSTFTELTPARIWRARRDGVVERGAGVVGGTVTAFVDGAATSLGPADTRVEATLLAVAASLAAGAPPESLAGALPALEPPPHRAALVGRRGGTLLVDDTMAATPTKAAATYGGFPPTSIVAVVGGERQIAGLAVHASPEEEALLDEACGVVRRVARAIVAFGPAGAALAPALEATAVVETIDEAIAVALELADGAAAVVVSPMHPLSSAERRRAADALRG